MTDHISNLTVVWSSNVTVCVRNAAIVARGSLEEHTLFLDTYRQLCFPDSHRTGLSRTSKPNCDE